MAVSRTIGVLTFHRCINYGSYWQARCLVRASPPAATRPSSSTTARRG